MKQQKWTLKPVIEFEPHNWLTEDYHKKIGTPQWNIYWDNFLKTLNIKPIESGSWLVSVEDIIEPTLIEKLVKISIDEETLFEDITFDNLDEEICVLRGGYALMEDDKVLLYPQCCCDLSDLDEWEKISNLSESEDWYQALMGHALMFARLKDNILIIKEIAEYNEKETIFVNLDKKALQTAVLQARREVSQFQGRLVSVIDNIFKNSRLSIEISRMLIGER